MVFHFEPNWFTEEEKIKLSSITNDSDLFNKSLLIEIPFYSRGLIQNFGRYTWLFEKIDLFVNEFTPFTVINPIKYMTIMKYDVGDFMMLHRDSIKYNRILIVSFVITDDYTGGELVLYDPTYVVEKNFGAVYCFDPFRFHEVKPIINGTRYSVMASYLVDNVKIKEKPERAF